MLEKIHEFFKHFIDKLKEIKQKLSKSSVVYSEVNHDIDFLEQSAEKIKTMLDNVQNVNTHSNQRFSLDVEVSKTDFESNIKKVANMGSVKNLDGTEFSKSDTDLITQVTDYFNSIGNEVKSKYGTIKLTRIGVKSSVAHGIGRNKAIAFKAVPDVLKHGEIIDYTENYKNRGYDTAVFSAPFSINNEPFYMAAIVIVDDKVNEYYLHEVVIKKQNEDETPFKTGTSQKTTPSDASSSIYTLLEKLQNVNKQFSKNTSIDSEGNELTNEQQEYFKDSKVRDEDGNLLVVYHGTSEDFTVFDKTKGRANMDIQGMFFSPWELDAQGYGSNVKAYYLNITNPAPEQIGYKALKMFQGQNNAGVKAREYLESLGYDGVNNGNEEYITFNSNQIKLIDNAAPTNKSDIRYSKDTNFTKALTGDEKKKYNNAIMTGNDNGLRISDNSMLVECENKSEYQYKYVAYDEFEDGQQITDVYAIGKIDTNVDDNVPSQYHTIASVINKTKEQEYDNKRYVRQIFKSYIKNTSYVLSEYNNNTSKFNVIGRGSVENGTNTLDKSIGRGSPREDTGSVSSDTGRYSRNTRLNHDENFDDVNEAFLGAVKVLQNVHIDDIDLSSEVVNKAESAAKHIQNKVKKSGYRTQKLTGKGSVHSIATELSEKYGSGKVTSNIY